MEIITQYQDGEYLVTEYVNGTIERRVQSAPQVIFPQAIRTISAIAFVRRFTEDEWAGLDVASLDDPTAGSGVRKAKAKLRRFLTKLLMRKLVDLDDADLSDDLAKLVAVGLLTSDRLAQLLADGAQHELD